MCDVTSIFYSCKYLSVIQCQETAFIKTASYLSTMVNCKSEMVDLEKKDSIALDFGYKYG